MDRAPEKYGSYLVYEQLGKGGMATVHRAEQVGSDGKKRQVALKRLIPTVQKEMVSLFLDEARLLNYLHHGNIAETYDSGKIFGTYFIAMEYVPGPNLRQLVQHCSATVGSVPEPITLSLAAQLCDALDHAHTRRDEKGAPLGIVHRDITPANIILSNSGALKLIDFGLAKAAGRVEDTAQGVIKGKYGYIAPEYLNGQIDHRVDLWAVGIIMYELLTSRRLFDGKDVFETIKRIKTFPIPRPSIGNPRVSSELDDVVMQALERDPRRRWQSASDMGAALRRVISTQDCAVDNDHIAEWVRWALALHPGAEVSGVSTLAAMLKARPQTPAPEIGDDDATRVDTGMVIDADMLSPLARFLWMAGAVVWVIAVIAGITWWLAGKL